MTDFSNIGGMEITAIENKEFMCFETVNVSKICIALDKSGIPFSARFGDTAMVLTFDGSYKEQVEEIIKKANSGDYEALLRELKIYGVPDGYYRLLSEVADILNTTVGILKARPDDVQLILCKTYVDFWLCDNATIQRELDRIITVNGRTLQGIQEHEKNRTQEKSPEQSTNDFRRNAHAHFTRESHKYLSEIARRRQQADHEKTIQTEEIERRKRP